MKKKYIIPESVVFGSITTKLLGESGTDKTGPFNDDDAEDEENPGWEPAAKPHFDWSVEEGLDDRFSDCLSNNFQ